MMPKPAEQQRPLRHIRQDCHGASKRCRNCADQRVPVLDMPQLVGDHRSDLILVQKTQQPGGHRNRAVLRVTSGRKRIRRRRVDQIDARHRQVGALRQLSNHLVQTRRFVPVDLPRASQAQRQSVGKPVCAAVHQESEQESNQHTLRAAKPPARQNQQHGQCRQQGCRFQCIRQSCHCQILIGKG